VFGEAPGSDSLPDLRDEPSFEGEPPGAPGVPGGTAANDGSGSAGNAAPGGAADGDTAGSGGGPLTPAEQVAILDAQLEQGAGEFDAIILETEAAQRRAAREQTAGQATASAAGQPGSEGGGPGGAAGAADSPYGEGMGGAGDYSAGGGIGGASRGGGTPANTAKYPPPKDIPSGDDDDVVARQLREAAMREPDPAVREKLWNEYRKYKGIEP